MSLVIMPLMPAVQRSAWEVRLGHSCHGFSMPGGIARSSSRITVLCSFKVCFGCMSQCFKSWGAVWHDPHQDGPQGRCLWEAAPGCNQTLQGHSLPSCLAEQSTCSQCHVSGPANTN